MGVNEQILDVFRRTGVEQLLPMVKVGQVSLIQEEGSKIKGVMSAHLVNLEEETAWKILLDYDKYCKFLPGITVSKVLSRRDNEIVVKFEAGVKVSGIGGSVKYTYRFIVNRPYVEVYDMGKHELSGYWAILPTPEPKQVIILHSDVAKDVKSIHIFLKFLVDRLPTAEAGLHVSPVVMLVNRMKQHMEQCGGNYHEKKQ